MPDDIRQNLLDRYEYVVAEKEVIPDLTDALRLCKPCQLWCPRRVMTFQVLVIKISESSAVPTQCNATDVNSSFTCAAFSLLLLPNLPAATGGLVHLVPASTRNRLTVAKSVTYPRLCRNPRPMLPRLGEEVGRARIGPRRRERRKSLLNTSECGPFVTLGE